MLFKETILVFIYVHNIGFLANGSDESETNNKMKYKIITYIACCAKWNNLL